MNKMLLVFFILISALNNVFGSLSEDFEITFFNVGQGNCTLVKCPGGSPLIVDGGSSQNPLPIIRSNVQVNLNALRYVQDIKDRLNEYLPVAVTTVDINVVVSHGDKDHYNKLPEILEDFSNNGKSIHFTLGGEENDYYDPSSNTKGYQLDFKNLLKKTNSTIHFSRNLGHNTLPALHCGSVISKYLSAKGDNPNAGSIVLKLTYGNLSTILTGDAEGVTTNYILKNKAVSNTLQELETNILQACHHGADTHESNNLSWMSHTKPEYMIISAGKYEGLYFHPKYSVIENFLLFSPRVKTGVQNHKLTCSGKQKFIINARGITNPNQYHSTNFNELNTTNGIYNTHDSGHIFFKWKSNDTELTPPLFL